MNGNKFKVYFRHLSLCIAVEHSWTKHLNAISRFIEQIKKDFQDLKMELTTAHEKEGSWYDKFQDLIIRYNQDEISESCLNEYIRTELLEQDLANDRKHTPLLDSKCSKKV